MSQKILLTSFDIWEPHHISNSSDDLLAELSVRQLLNEHIYLLRKLPVDFQLAPEHVILRVDQLKPDVIVCCGMAESRKSLTVESNGKCQEKILFTPINLDALVQHLIDTTISDDAGAFVCNHLYYSVLHHLQTHHPTAKCLFVHVPVLNQQNLETIVRDFMVILNAIDSMGCSIYS